MLSWASVAWHCLVIAGFVASVGISIAAHRSRLQEMRRLFFCAKKFLSPWSISTWSSRCPNRCALALKDRCFAYNLIFQAASEALLTVAAIAGNWSPRLASPYPYETPLEIDTSERERPEFETAVNC